MDRLAQEFEAVGFYLSGHPLDDYMKPLQKLGVETFAAFRDNRCPVAAGIDVVLVGDSASNVMAGHETTLPITLDQMISEMVAHDLEKAKQHALLKKHGYEVKVSVE